MKRLFLGILFLFAAVSSQSQVAELQDLKNDSIFLSDVLSLLHPQEIVASVEEEKEDFMNEHWTTRSFQSF